MYIRIQENVTAGRRISAGTNVANFSHFSALRRYSTH